MTSIETGATFEDKLIEYFKIDTHQPIDKVREDLEKITTIKEDVECKYNQWFNKKRWHLQLPFLDATYDQWSRLESLLAEEDNINNLHKLLAIYFRPKKFYLFRTKFNMKSQDKIEQELLDYDIDKAKQMLLFFSHNATRYLRNMNISYLNMMKQQTK